MPSRSPRFPSRHIPPVQLGDAIRRRVGRGEYHLSPDGEVSGEGSGESRTKRRTGRGTKISRCFLSDKSILSYWRWRLRLSRFITTGRRVREQFFLFLFLLSGLGSWLLIRRLPYALKDGGRCFPYRGAAAAIAMTVYFAVSISQICRLGTRPRLCLPRRIRIGRPA